MSGPTLGSYELLSELGRGGMGRVFRARHLPTGAIRAVKVLDSVPDLETLDRFRREAESLARLNGEGVVPIHDTGVSGSRLFLAMDLMPGGSLRGALAKRGSFPWRDAATIVAGIARTLERCHALGLVHRDVKPDNVLLDDRGEPRLADFGCVRDLLAGGSLTATGTTLGTLSYMPPEQLAGAAVGPPADIYALGVLLYELVTGNLPHAGRTSSELALVALRGKRVPASGVAGSPRELDLILDRALAPEVAARYPSAAALEHDLEALLHDQVSVAARAHRTRVVRRGALLGGGIVLVLAGSLGLVAALNGSAGQRGMSVVAARESIRRIVTLSEPEVAALGSFIGTTAGADHEQLARTFSSGLKDRAFAAEQEGDSARALLALERAGTQEARAQRVHAILLALAGDLDRALTLAPDEATRDVLRARTALAQVDVTLARKVLASFRPLEVEDRALAAELGRLAGVPQKPLASSPPWDEIDNARRALAAARPWKAASLEALVPARKSSADLALAIEKARLALARLDARAAAVALEPVLRAAHSAESFFTQAEALALAADVAAAQSEAVSKIFPPDLSSPEKILEQGSRIALAWPPVVRALARQRDRDLARAGLAPLAAPPAPSIAAERSLSYSGELGLPGLVIAAAEETVASADRAGTVEASGPAVAAAGLALALCPSSPLAGVLATRAALQAHDLPRAEAACLLAVRLLPDDPETTVAAARVSLARLEVALDAGFLAQVSGKAGPPADVAALAENAIGAASRAVAKSPGSPEARLALARALARRLLTRPPAEDPVAALAPVRAALAPLLVDVPIGELAATSRTFTEALAALDARAIPLVEARMEALIVRVNRESPERTLEVQDALSILGEAEAASGEPGDAEAAFLLLALDGPARALHANEKKEARTRAQEAHPERGGHSLTSDEAETVRRLAPDLAHTMWDVAKKREEPVLGDWRQIPVSSVDALLDILRDRIKRDPTVGVRNAVYLPEDLEPIVDAPPGNYPAALVEAILRRAAADPGNPSLLVLRATLGRSAFGDADLDRVTLAHPDSFEAHVFAFANGSGGDARLRHAIGAFRLGYAPAPDERFDGASDDPVWEQLARGLVYRGEDESDFLAMKAHLGHAFEKARELARGAARGRFLGSGIERLALALAFASHQSSAVKLRACEAVLAASPDDAFAASTRAELEDASPREKALRELAVEAMLRPLADLRGARRARTTLTAASRTHGHRMVVDDVPLRFVPARHLARLTRVDHELARSLARRPWLGLARHATRRPLGIVRHLDALEASFDEPTANVGLLLIEGFRCRELGGLSIARHARNIQARLSPEVQGEALEPLRRFVRLLALMTDVWDDTRTTEVEQPVLAETLESLRALGTPCDERGPLVHAFAITGDADAVRCLLEPFLKEGLTEAERTAAVEIVGDPAVAKLAATDPDLARLVGRVK